jgi:hypothetical protein
MLGQQFCPGGAALFSKEEAIWAIEVNHSQLFKVHPYKLFARRERGVKLQLRTLLTDPVVNNLSQRA